MWLNVVPGAGLLCQSVRVRTGGISRAWFFCVSFFSKLVVLLTMCCLLLSLLLCLGLRQCSCGRQQYTNNGSKQQTAHSSKKLLSSLCVCFFVCVGMQRAITEKMPFRHRLVTNTKHCNPGRSHSESFIEEEEQIQMGPGFSRADQRMYTCIHAHACIAICMHWNSC